MPPETTTVSQSPVLLLVFETAFLVAMSAWIGAILFLSFGVAPIVFRTLDKEAASRFLRAVFPLYHSWGATAAIVAAGALVCRALSFEDLRGPAVGVQAAILVAAALVQLYSGQSLTPRINAARDAGEPEAAKFRALHKRSVALNGLTLALALTILVWFGVRPAPGTSGIRELKPEDRLRYAIELERELLRQRGKTLPGEAPPADR